MYGKKPDVDVINDLLLLSMAHYPDNQFLKSLHHQYAELGGLSRKQMEGLHAKAQKVKEIPSSKLATLEAEIKKKPVRFKSEKPESAPLYHKDEKAENMINSLLERFPQHKMVLFLREKTMLNKPLSSQEITELERLHKLLIK